MSVKTDFHVDRVYGYLRILLALFVFGISVFYLIDSLNYRPNASRIYFDMLERPMNGQNLLGFAEHNEGYGKAQQSVESFGQEAILSLFNYHFKDLETGKHKQVAMEYFSARAFEEIYRTFFGLTYNRIVEAQEGIVESNTVNGFKVTGTTDTIAYQGNSSEKVMSYRVEGALIVELNADDSEKDVYNIKMFIQRAPVQDKVRGYQVVLMEISS